MTLKTRLAATALAVVLLAFMSALLLSKSSWGEGHAQRYVEQAVSGSGPAHLVMDRLGDFELFSPVGVVRATAEGIRFLTPDGDEILRINELTGELNLRALLSRELFVQGLTIRGGQVPFDVEAGRPRIAIPRGRAKAFEPRPMDVRVENVEVEGLYFVAPQPDGQNAVVGRLVGGLDLTASRYEPGVKMKIRGFKGFTSQPMSVRLHDATGEVDTGAEMVADLRFSADATGKAFTGRVQYYPGDRDDPLKLTIDNVRALPGSLPDPMGSLGGMGLPMDMLRKMAPAVGQSIPK